MDDDFLVMVEDDATSDEVQTLAYPKKKQNSSRTKQQRKAKKNKVPRSDDTIYPKHHNEVRDEREQCDGRVLWEGSSVHRHLQIFGLGSGRQQLSFVQFLSRDCSVEDGGK